MPLRDAARAPSEKRLTCVLPPAARRTPLGVFRETISSQLVAYPAPLGWGQTVLRESEWEGEVLVSRHYPTTPQGGVDPERVPVTTRRWVEDGLMVQEAHHEGHSFRRVFRRGGTSAAGS